MKRFFICAVFALSLCGLTAQAQEAEAPAAAAVAQPNALKEFTAVMTELTDLLRGVTDKATADAAVPAEIHQIPLELRAEGSITDVMDLTLETVFVIMKQHTARIRTQMRMIIYAKENVQCTFSFRSYTKKSTHRFFLFLRLLYS